MVYVNEKPPVVGVVTDPSVTVTAGVVKLCDVGDDATKFVPTPSLSITSHTLYAVDGNNTQFTVADCCAPLEYTAFPLQPLTKPAPMAPRMSVVAGADALVYAAQYAFVCCPPPVIVYVIENPALLTDVADPKTTVATGTTTF